jgi:hypothetical protein
VLESIQQEQLMQMLKVNLYQGTGSEEIQLILQTGQVGLVVALLPLQHIRGFGPVAEEDIPGVELDLMLGVVMGSMAEEAEVITLEI